MVIKKNPKPKTNKSSAPARSSVATAIATDMAALAAICESVHQIYDVLNQAIQSPAGQALLGIIYQATTSSYFNFCSTVQKDLKKKTTSSTDKQVELSKLMKSYFNLVIVTEVLAERWADLADVLEAEKTGSAKNLAKELGRNLSDLMSRMDGKTLRHGVESAIFQTILLAALKTNAPQAARKVLKL